MADFFYPFTVLINRVVYQILPPYSRLGRHAEALATYRRCRETLAKVLKLTPSPATQADIKHPRHLFLPVSHRSLTPSPAFGNMGLLVRGLSIPIYIKMTRAPTLAKLSAPTVGKVLPRPRLFRALDKARRHPVVWITAPPGAGKTTLVASYLARRRLRSLWYQLDAGDNDLATFFRYLGVAAGKASRRRTPLPALTPEYRSNVLIFARRYFESLYQRLNPKTVLVFDNYQDVAEDAELHEVLREGMAALPAGINIMLVSRAEPPVAFARVRAHGALALLDWDSVRLTVDESVRLAALRRRTPSTPSRALVQKLHERAQGWTAGLLLLLEQSDPEQALAAGQGQPTEVLFDYFASEVLQKTNRTTQEVLLKTALLPQMTAAMAERLSERRESARILAELNRKNYFTIKHGHGTPMYQYHPLFREFLLSRARRTFTLVELTQLQHRAATILEKSGQLEDAAALYQTATDWASLTRLILAHAPALLAQGRNPTLEQWLGGLPPAVVDENPWLLYWRGMCRMPFDIPQNRADLERAFQLFETQADAGGSFLSWAGVVDTFFHQWHDFKPLDQWLAAFDTLHARYPRFPSKDIEFRVISALFSALLYRQPQHPDIGTWARRLETLLHQEPDINHRLIAAALLMLYHIWTWNFERSVHLIRTLKPLLSSPHVTPLTKLLWHMVNVGYDWIIADYDTARAALQAGLEVTQASGIQLYESRLSAQYAYIGLRTNDLASVAEGVRKMGTDRHNQLMDVAHYHYLRSALELLQGNVGQALEQAQEAARLTSDLGTPFAEAVCRTWWAQALLQAERPREAAAQLMRAHRIGQGMRSKMLLGRCALVESQLAFTQGDETAGFAALRKVIEIYRDYKIIPADIWYPPALTRLCAKALSAGIEPECVRDLIRKYRLTADASMLELEHWPWPLKIYTFGRFVLARDDKSIRFNGKTPRKPLELLKALVALGGNAVSQTHLTEALWPEAEGDSARRAFDTTLHRLRKLLPENALTLEDGKLQLNTHTVWIDTKGLDWELQRVERALKGGSLLTPAQLNTYSQSVLRLYRGPFLPEEDASWALAPREQWQLRILQLLRRLGRYCEDQGTLEAALIYYEQGITLDPCIEEFYQRLMRLYQRLGRQAEALSVYARCRKTLLALLQITPSPTTERLYQDLRKS